MRCCRLLRIDSYKAARRDVRSLFAPGQSSEAVRRNVRHYISPHNSSHSISRSATISDNWTSSTSNTHRHSRTQRRSLMRSNLSLVLREARMQGNHRVAIAALDLAVAEADFFAEIAPAWVKDAVAACSTVSQLQELEAAVLERQRIQMQGGDSESTSPWATRANTHHREDEVEEENIVGDDYRARCTAGSDAVRRVCALLQRLLGPASQQQQEQHSSLSVSSNEYDLERRKEDAESPMQAMPPSTPLLASATSRVVSAPNRSFIRYFQRQGLVHSEQEVMTLFAAMRAPRSMVAFRVHRTLCYGLAVCSLLHEMHSVQPVGWLPVSCAAYVMNNHDNSSHSDFDTHIGNTHGESVSWDVLTRQRQLLRALARERLVSFQSLPSMLPVHLLDARAGDCVLDLCAAPGGKTAMILDRMCHDRINRNNRSGRSDCDARWKGCVVANEPDEQRAMALSRRLRHMAPQVVITRMHGEWLHCRDNIHAQYNYEDGLSRNDHPHPHKKKTDDSYSVATATTTTTTTANAATVDGSPDFHARFHKILVDAPCSGDGRLGKEAMLWRLWHPRRALEFFPRQCALLRRAVRLCAVGGRVVYATCSMNPLENEAVVAAVLRECAGSVVLVDVSRLMEEIQSSHTDSRSSGSSSSSRSSSRYASAGAIESRSSNSASGSALVMRRIHPKDGMDAEDGIGAGAQGDFDLELSDGLSQWGVPSRDGGFYDTVEQAWSAGESTTVVRRELFAPTEHEAQAWGGLRRCRRVMPHRNGGAEGFFVAVLHVRAALPSSSAAVCAALAAPPLGRNSCPAFPSSPLLLCANEATRRQACSGQRGAVSRCGMRFGETSAWFHERGLLCVPLTRPDVRQLFAPFFRSTDSTQPLDHCRDSIDGGDTCPTCSALEDFFARTGLTVVWHATEGWRLVSSAALAMSRSIDAADEYDSASTPHRSINSHEDIATTTSRCDGDHRTYSLVTRGRGAGGSLLDVGVVAFAGDGPAASATLTESGAQLLKPYASARVWALALPHVQTLLARQVLRHDDVGTVERTVREVYPLLPAPQNQPGGSEHSWCSDAVKCGNAIVTVDIDSCRGYRGSGGVAYAKASRVDDGSGDAGMAALQQWALPVWIDETASSERPGCSRGSRVRHMRLLLPPAARERCMALLGRVLSCSRRRRHRVERVALHEGARFSAETMMSRASLYGAAGATGTTANWMWHAQERADGVDDGAKGGADVSAPTRTDREEQEQEQEEEEERVVEL